MKPEENGVESRKMVFHEEWPSGTTEPLLVDGVMTRRIRLQNPHLPTVALMFHAKNNESFTVILTAIHGAPTITMVVPLISKTLTEMVSLFENRLPYLNRREDYHLYPLIEHERGPDRFSIPLQSQHRASVVFQKRALNGDKVYHVHITLAVDSHPPSHTTEQSLRPLTHGTPKL